VNTDDIKILLEFLDLFGPDATGREKPEPQADVASKLDRFAQGACDDDERAEVCELLRLHPAWLRWVADRVRLARLQRPAVAGQH
jgi:hypothetical protein